MSVEIDPLELSFRSTSLSIVVCFSSTPSSDRPGPFTVEVGQILRIKNPNAAPVAFKVSLDCPVASHPSFAPS